MSNFKVGEKVVFIKKATPNNEHKLPKDNEIVEICGFDIENKDRFYISGYENDILGRPQPIHKMHLNKLDHSFGEKIYAEILESIKVKEEQLN